MLFSIVLVSFSLFSLAARPAESNELLDYVMVALRQSDAAKDLFDTQYLSEMSVATEEHRFDLEYIPLSNVGVAKGTGSQTLGMEVRKEHSFGLTMTAGLRGDRTDLDSEYSVENENSVRAYVKMSQGLFRRWGEKYNLANYTIAQLKLKEQLLSNERQRQDLILATVKNYYQLVLSRQLVGKSEVALERSQEHLAAAKSRQSVGLVSKVDVYRAELAALDAESALQQQKRSWIRAKDDFNEQLGYQEYNEFEVANTVHRVVPVVPVDWSEALLSNRLDWYAYRIKVQYGQLDIYKAEANLKPDLNLNVIVEQKGEGDSMSEATDLNETNWSMQLELNSAFDVFAEENALTVSTMNMSKLRREGASLRRRIFRQARESFDDLKMEEHSHQISIKRLKQSGNALELTKIRYERGLSDNLDVLDSESAFSEAELDTSRTLVAYNVAAVKLAYDLGVLDVEWLRLSRVGDSGERAHLAQASPVF